MMTTTCKLVGSYAKWSYEHKEEWMDKYAFILASLSVSGEGWTVTGIVCGTQLPVLHFANAQEVREFAHAMCAIAKGV